MICEYAIIVWAEHSGCLRASKNYPSLGRNNSWPWSQIKSRIGNNLADQHLVCAVEVTHEGVRFNLHRRTVSCPDERGGKR